MMPFILWIANKLGITDFIAKLIVAGVVIFALVIAGLTIRHHYVALGYAKAIAAVKKQDDRAVEAATKVEEKATVCTDQNGYWDVVTQGCKLEDEK